MFDKERSSRCRVAALRKIFITFCLSHVIKDKNRIWTRIARWIDVAVVGKRKVPISSIDVHVLEYAVRALKQVYENVGFAAIRRA